MRWPRGIWPCRTVWASDYPHIDASFGVVHELKKRLAPLPAEARRKVLGLNARRFYRLAD